MRCASSISYPPSLSLSSGFLAVSFYRFSSRLSRLSLSLSLSLMSRYPRLLLICQFSRSPSLSTLLLLYQFDCVFQRRKGRGLSSIREKERERERERFEKVDKRRMLIRSSDGRLSDELWLLALVNSEKLGVYLRIRSFT